MYGEACNVRFSNLQCGGMVVHKCKHRLGAERVALVCLGESRMCMGKPVMCDISNSQSGGGGGFSNPSTNMVVH